MQNLRLWTNNEVVKANNKLFKTLGKFVFTIAKAISNVNFKEDNLFSCPQNYVSNFENWYSILIKYVLMVYENFAMHLELEKG
jgi:hypothetical protein